MFATVHDVVMSANCTSSHNDDVLTDGRYLPFLGTRVSTPNTNLGSLVNQTSLESLRQPSPTSCATPPSPRCFLPNEALRPPGGRDEGLRRSGNDAWVAAGRRSVAAILAAAAESRTSRQRWPTTSVARDCYRVFRQLLPHVLTMSIPGKKDAGPVLEQPCHSFLQRVRGVARRGLSSASPPTHFFFLSFFVVLLADQLAGAEASHLRMWLRGNIRAC